jgi:glycosyltransferase involved in cell wall biosynthesis
LRIAYVNYGEQSGVTAHVRAALEALGHHVVPVFGRGPLELRDPGTRRLRPTPRVLAHLAVAALRYGGEALRYRWNTPFAFDVHSRWAGELLAGLPAPVDVVLQNGALFSPGLPPALPYVVYLDSTRAMAERRHAPLSPHTPSWGGGWFRRERATYAGAASIATFSEHAARSLREDYAVEPARIRVAGAGPNVLPAHVERADDGETILFVGREFDRKGGPVLLEAFQRLRRTRRRAKLLVVGPSEPLSLPEGVVQVGPVLYEALPALFARATLFALPTLREPFGIAFLDAMACAVPCVGSRIESVPEIVEEDRSGVLVPPGDAGALQAALEHLLARPGMARAMGERGRHRVLTQLNWELAAHRLSERLASALARHHERPSDAVAYP